MSTFIRRDVDSLFDSLAPHYDDHFAVSHRKAYDDLAWEMCEPMWRRPELTIVDVGCGVGRWAERWLTAGHHVIGIEPSPAMAEQASVRLSSWLKGSFTLIRSRAEDAELAPTSVDAVVAMGSLQYTDSPTHQIARMAEWLRPGGSMAVLVDSLWGLVIELVRRGDAEQAMERLRTRQGIWQVSDLAAPLHLLDVSALRNAADRAGLTNVEVSGLLVGASFWGIDELRSRLAQDEPGNLDLERQLATRSDLADLGKQLLLRSQTRV